MAISVGTLSYAAAAAAYCFLTILLITSWRGRLPGALLTFASLVTAAWAGVMSYQASHPDTWKLPGELVEVAHKAAWFLFLLVLLGYARKTEHAVDKGLQRVALSILGGCGAILLLTVALRLPPDSDLL